MSVWEKLTWTVGVVFLTGMVLGEIGVSHNAVGLVNVAGAMILGSLITSFVGVLAFIWTRR